MSAVMAVHLVVYANLYHMSMAFSCASVGQLCSFVSVWASRFVHIVYDNLFVFFYMFSFCFLLFFLVLWSMDQDAVQHWLPEMFSPQNVQNSVLNAEVIS